jgi:hypothetical protein
MPLFGQVRLEGDRLLNMELPKITEFRVAFDLWIAFATPYRELSLNRLASFKKVRYHRSTRSF